MREASAFTVILLLGGCNERDLPPLRYETEHLRIATDFGGPICAGTLHELDQQVQFVEQALDFNVQGQLELYLFKDSVVEWCGEPFDGCYSHREKRAYATVPIARHELVHAAVAQLHSAGSAFLDEGFAVDLTGEGLVFPETYPSSNLGLPSRSVSRPTAGHFMRWLRSQYTISELKSLYLQSDHDQSANQVEAVFAQATGNAFAEDEQSYFETAPEFFKPFDIVAPPVFAPENGGWDILLEFDCEQVNTEGYDDEMWRRVRVEVTTPGQYVLVVTSPATATITLRRSEDLQVGEPIPVPLSWPIGDDLFDPPEAWLPNLPIQTWLDTGTYDIEVLVRGVSPTSAAVGIHPQIGPISELP